MDLRRAVGEALARLAVEPGVREVEVKVISVERDGWAHFDWVKMPEYRWGIFLAEPEPDPRDEIVPPPPAVATPAPANPSEAVGQMSNDPKKRFGRCNALASTPPVSTLPDDGTTVL